VGSTYNFLAPLYHEVRRNFERGDLAAANACQLRAVDMIETILRHHGNSGLKAAMSLTGIPCGPSRLPLAPIDAAEREVLRDALDALGYFDLIGGNV